MIDAAIARKHLQECKEVLDGLGIPFCLFLGTALGAYRDRDFCPGDIDDIDLAIHADHYHASDLKIKRAMLDRGFSYHDYHSDDAIAHEIAFSKMHDGHAYKIDIFFLVPKDGKMVWTFYNTPEGVQNRTIDSLLFLSFNRLHGVFVEGALNIPNTIERYLEANYGPDWRKPIERKDWLWHRDNKCPII